MADYWVGRANEIAEGSRKVVRCGTREIGIFRIKGALHAWHNRCPHRQGPVCQGRIYARVTEPVNGSGEVGLLQYDENAQHIVCPWHGYEFDLETGLCNGLNGTKLIRAELKTVEGDLYVVL